MTREEAAIKSCEDRIKHLESAPPHHYGKRQRERAIELEKVKIKALRPVSLEQVKRALAMMWFAYVNSDKETPHSYETDALEEAESILGPWAECMPKYLKRGPEEG